MRSVLLFARINGFKCIEEPIEIQFANKTIDESIFSKPLVKAIYGSNGTGKSAIIYAFDVYKKTVIDDYFLAVENARGNLKDMINQKNKKASIELYFAVRLKSNLQARIYHHIISYSLKGDQTVYIDFEKLTHVKNMSWGNEQNEEVVYEIKNGEISNMYPLSKPINDLITDKSKNLLTSSSMLGKWITVFGSQSGDFGKDSSPMLYSVCAYIFVMFIQVFIDEKDSNKVSVTKINAAIDSLNKLQKSGIKNIKEFVVDDEIDEIAVDKYDSYLKEVDRITNFLKIFKPDLEKIDIDKDITSDNKYLCKKILVYKNGVRVSSRFESNGIKKLIKLYPLLNSSEYGGILAIDEIDSNIHDVYLCKLIEYFSYYSQCQLVFTTHNLGPMEVLGDSKLKYTIDFINNSRITSWKKNGNYSVVNVYRSGAIPNCPFNINAADFIKVIG